MTTHTSPTRPRTWAAPPALDLELTLDITIEEIVADLDPGMLPPDTAAAVVALDALEIAANGLAYPTRDAEVA